MEPFHCNVRSWVSPPPWQVALVCCGAVSLASIGNTSGSIIYSGEKNIVIPQDFAGVFINLTDFQSGASGSSSWDLNPFFGGLGIANAPGFQPVRIGTGNEDPILPLALGSSIGGSSTFSSEWGGSGAEDDSGHIGPGASQFADGQIGYMGFKLIREDTVNYGWMRVILTQNGDTGSILDWAYDTSGNSMISGFTRDLGATPTVHAAGTSQTFTTSGAGTGILMESGAQITFDQGPNGGEFSGKIDGAGEIRISGAGGLRLTGDNLFSGTVAVLVGSRLTVTDSGNLGSAEVEIGASASLIFDSLPGNDGSSNVFSNAITTTGPLAIFKNSGDGKVVLGGSISSNSDSLGFSGGDFDVQGSITGAGSLLKEGSGTLTLAGANTYSGGTTVRTGELIVNGTLASTSGVVVETAGTLKGSGSIGGDLTVTSGGILAPGNSPGVLTTAGTTNFASGSIFDWELDTAQSDPETNRGTAYDGLNTTAVTGSGAIFKILLTGNQDFGDAFWNQDRVWTDIFKSADGSQTLSDWASVFSGGFQYSYNGKTIAPTSSGSFALAGNSLTWSAVPEPSNALAGLLAAAALFRRSRNKKS